MRKREVKGSFTFFRIIDPDAGVLWNIQLFEQKIHLESDLKLVGKRLSQFDAPLLSSFEIRSTFS